MNIITYILVFLAIIATILPILKREHWLIRFFDFPYVQFTIFIILSSAIISTWHPHSSMYWLILSCLAILILFRLYIIIPYTVFSPVSVPANTSLINYDKSNKSIKIISSNVLMYNKNYQGLLDILKVEDPDIILLVETDQKWKDAIHSQLNKKYPYSLLHPLGNTYGLLFYSKYQLSDSEINYLVEDDVPSIETTLNIAEDCKVRFFGIHPKPPSPTENYTSLPRDVELIKIGRKARVTEIPVIVAGDLNDVAWSHTTRLFIRISGLLDPRIGRGFFNTYPANYPLLRWPLDHLFLSRHFKIITMRRLNNYDSDHFPICAEVLIEPSLKAKESVKNTTKEDRLEAKEKLARINI